MLSIYAYPIISGSSNCSRKVRSRKHLPRAKGGARSGIQGFQEGVGIL